MLNLKLQTSSRIQSNMATGLSQDCYWIGVCQPLGGFVGVYQIQLTIHKEYLQLAGATTAPHILLVWALPMRKLQHEDAAKMRTRG